jgi:hypothetical protein
MNTHCIEEGKEEEALRQGVADRECDQHDDAQLPASSRGGLAIQLLWITTTVLSLQGRACGVGPETYRNSTVHRNALRAGGRWTGRLAWAVMVVMSASMSSLGPLGGF